MFVGNIRIIKKTRRHFNVLWLTATIALHLRDMERVLSWCEAIHRNVMGKEMFLQLESLVSRLTTTCFTAECFIRFLLYENKSDKSLSCKMILRSVESKVSAQKIKTYFRIRCWWSRSSLHSSQQRNFSSPTFHCQIRSRGFFFEYSHNCRYYNYYYHYKLPAQSKEWTSE